MRRNHVTNVTAYGKGTSYAPYPALLTSRDLYSGSRRGRRSLEHVPFAGVVTSVTLVTEQEGQNCRRQGSRRMSADCGAKSHPSPTGHGRPASTPPRPRRRRVAALKHPAPAVAQPRQFGRLRWARTTPLSTLPGVCARRAWTSGFGFIARRSRLADRALRQQSNAVSNGPTRLRPVSAAESRHP